MHWSPTSSRSALPRVRLRKPAPTRPPHQRKQIEVRCNKYAYSHTSTRTRELPEHEVRSVVLVAHHGPQTHCAPLSPLHHVLFLHRRLLRAAHPPRVAHTRGRSGPGRYLQQALHHARNGHGVLFLDSVHPRRARQFSRAPDDRGQGSRLPPHQPVELVSLHHRRRDDAALHADRRRRYRLDVLRPLQHQLHQHKNRRSRIGHLRRGILFYPHRPELRRYHPPHARPRHDLVAPTPVYLGALRYQHHSASGHSGHRRHHRAGRGRARSAPRHLRS